MSAIGISGSGRFAPRFISAHADHRRSDFVFPRTQSLGLRDAPWECRLKPMRTWSEIGAYGGVALAATVLMTALI
jgi:hypothetical protein